MNKGKLFGNNYENLTCGFIKHNLFKKGTIELLIKVWVWTIDIVWNNWNWMDTWSLITDEDHVSLLKVILNKYVNEL